MTTLELLKSVADLNWTVRYGLRCEKGNCPIIAAYYKALGPEVLTNNDWETAARFLNFDKENARALAVKADAYPINLLGEIKELLKEK